MSDRADIGRVAGPQSKPTKKARKRNEIQRQRLRLALLLDVRALVPRRLLRSLRVDCVKVKVVQKALKAQGEISGLFSLFYRRLRRALIKSMA